MNLQYKAHLITMYENQRVAVLIDTQNMYHSTHSLFNSNLNYEKILKKAVNGRNLIRAISYVVKADTPEEERFFEAIQDIGFEVRVKELKTYYDGTKKGDWDMGIALDAISLANKVDTIVLISGDGDFTALLKRIKAKGTRAEVISFKKSTSNELIEEATDYVDIESLSDKDDYLM